jgi:hypothetical protein
MQIQVIVNTSNDSHNTLIHLSFKSFGAGLLTWKMRCSQSISKKPQQSLLTTVLGQLPTDGLLFVLQVAVQ